ncbi:hypothetical protein EO087_14020 [Dyella sp. M7H15-1]|uniref:hypothetical protein n=1 Tax=Dyella sp. M7H15-1 TaxID=2501295 RepID=UPI00100510B5|nr:hypothetical protein [Dyella sp. M7H15-1]QAU24972.1 hypothetical protein EO087_14020 [Dyella sp. M7H15-1]
MHITSFQRFSSEPSYNHNVDDDHALAPRQNNAESVLDLIKSIASFGITSFYESYRMDAKMPEMDKAINEMLTNGLNFKAGSPDPVLLYSHASDNNPYRLVLQRNKLVAISLNGFKELKTFKSQNDYRDFLSNLCDIATRHEVLRDEVRDQLILSDVLNRSAMNSNETNTLDLIKSMASFGITSFESCRMNAIKNELSKAINDILTNGLNFITGSDPIILYSHSSDNNPYKLVLHRNIPISESHILVAESSNGTNGIKLLKKFNSQNDYKSFLSNLCNIATRHGVLRDEVRDQLILSDVL